MKSVKFMARGLVTERIFSLVLHMMTENLPFCFLTVTRDNIFFFSRKPIFFCFTTLIQLPIAHIKITFLNFFDRVPQLPAFNGSGY
jgi:hypothetical protein